MTILGIESTAHTFGVGVVKNGKILSNVKRTYTTEEGGIIPMDAAKHHFENKNEIYFEALDKAGIKEKDIDAIAFSQGPGLAPCLIEGMKFAKELSKRLGSLQSRLQIDKINNKKTHCSLDIINSRTFQAQRDKSSIPIIPVNHCIAHLEVGKTTGAKDPVMLYVSGANTQVISYEEGRYRIFGETLDIGVGNFIDNFARLAGIGFPGGPSIEKLAKKGKNYIELPYKVKGMDIALSGILTNLKQKIEKINRKKETPAHPCSQIDDSDNKKTRGSFNIISSKISRATLERDNSYTLADLAFSMQETVFAMLVETAERALAHTGKKELLLGGGVACNSRLQEMCRIMCKERFGNSTRLFVPDKSLLVDNGGMIAFLGEIILDSMGREKTNNKISRKNKFNVKIKNKSKNNLTIDNSKKSQVLTSAKSKLIYYPDELDKVDIKPRQRTDDVEVIWKD